MIIITFQNFLWHHRIFLVITNYSTILHRVYGFHSFKYGYWDYSMASIQWLIRWSWLIVLQYNFHPYVNMYTAGWISAIIIVAVLIITALSITLAVIILAKLKNDRHQNVIRGLKSELRWGIVMIAHPCDWSCSQLWIHMRHQLFIISGDKSDLNDTPVKPHDEGHASTQGVYMCYVSHSVSLMELIYHIIIIVTHCLGGFYVI